MTRLVWDIPEERSLKTGIDRGILYPKNTPGVVWNGLSSVAEHPMDSNVIVGYFDGQKYIQECSGEGFAATIQAFTYPDAFNNGYSFGFSYRIQKDIGYEIHVIYNATVTSSDSAYQTDATDTESTVFSWDLTTTPIQIPGVKATSHLIIDTNKTYSWVVALLEDLLYGSDSIESALPLPSAIIAIFEANSLLRIIDNGDGTWTAIGPDDWIIMLDSTTFQITSPSAIFIDVNTYKISSW